MAGRAAAELHAFADALRSRRPAADCVLLGHGRLQPRPRGPPARAFGGTRSALPRARHAPTPTAIKTVKRAADLSKTLLYLVSTKSRRDDRDDAAAFQSLLGAVAGAERLASFAADHRPRHAARGASRASAASAAVFMRRPGDRRALQRSLLLRHRARRRCIGRRRRQACSRARMARAAAASSGATEDNPGVWLGATLGALAEGGPRQAHVRRRRPEFATLRRSGSSSWSPSRPASTARASCPIARRAARRAEVYGDDRVFVHAARRQPSMTSSCARSREPGQCRHHDLARRRRRPRPAHVPRWSSPPPWRAGLLEHQPVRPAQRAGGEGQDEARCSDERRAGRSREAPTADHARAARGRRRRPTCAIQRLPTSP